MIAPSPLRCLRVHVYARVRVRVRVLAAGALCPRVARARHLYRRGAQGEEHDGSA